MARIRISDLTSATLPVAGTSLVELSVANGAAPSGYDSRKQTVANMFAPLSVPIQQGAVNINAGYQGIASIKTDYNELAVYGNGAAGGYVYLSHNYAQGWVGTDANIPFNVIAGGAAGYLTFDTGDPLAERMRIAANGTTTLSGNLNIGPIAGSNPLQVTVNNGFNNLVRTNVVGTHTWDCGTLASDGSYIVYDGTSSVTRLKIDPSGNCSASSTWSVISDARLKVDLTPYPRGLTEVLALEPITYKWTGKGGVPADGEIHYGLTAQQVEKVMPELIREHEYVPPAEGRDDDEPMTLKTYSPTDLTFALIGAVKELAARLDKIEGALSAPKE